MNTDSEWRRVRRSVGAILASAVAITMVTTLAIGDGRHAKKDHHDRGESTMTGRQKITPFLWFDGNADEAIDFYMSVFKNSRLISVSRHGDAGPGTKGKVMTATFELEGQRFMALSGGPMYKFTEAISLFVNCETQQEVDELWEKLSEGGEQGRCGWLKDRFGLSWQIVPSALGELLQDKDPAKAKRVAEAMLQMGKIDIARLKSAHAGR